MTRGRIERTFRATSAIIVLTFGFPCGVARGDEALPASPPPGEPASEAASEQARAHYRRGVELFDDGDYRLALVEFERAHALSRSYKILYNVGQVRFQLFDYAKARAALERYLAEGGSEVPPERRSDVEKDLATLRTRTATLSVEANVAGALVSIDDEDAGAAPVLRALVNAGTRRVTASSRGHETRSTVVTLAGGDDRTVRIELPKVASQVVVVPTEASAPERGLPTVAVVGWIGAGVLTAAAVGTGIAALSASSRYDTLRTTPIGGSSQEAASTLDRQQGLVDGLALATDILVVSAIVAGGASLYLTLRGRPAAKAAVRAHATRGGIGVSF